jgi:hypothetical protein
MNSIFYFKLILDYCYLSSSQHVPIVAHVTRWHKKKLRRGNWIFLFLSYSVVVELRPRPTWSKIVIRYSKEINLYFNSSFRLKIVDVKIGDRHVGGLSKFSIRACWNPWRVLKKRL